MRNSKRVIALITALIFAVTLMTSCAKKLTPKETMDEFLKAVKAGDSDKVEELNVDGEMELGDFFDEITEGEDSELELDDKTEKLLRKKILDFDYKLGTETIDNKKATVNVTIKGYDFGGGVSKWFTEYLEWTFSQLGTEPTEEEMSKKASELFKKHVASVEKTFSSKVQANLVKEDGKWKVDTMENNTELIDAMTGGMYGVFQTLSNSAGEGGDAGDPEED